MAQSHLITHCGARSVTREELNAFEAPAPTKTWFPLPHRTILGTVEEMLSQAGFRIEREQFALSRHHARFFGTLDLASPIAVGTTLAVGIRNSTDKSLPIGFCAGSRVMVCDNLAFRSEITVARKHTRFGEERFSEAIARAVGSLQQFRETEGTRIRVLQRTAISDTESESLMLRAYERGIVSHRLLPRVITEWRSPSFAEFSDRTYWSLFNAFTTVLTERQKSNPQLFASLTLRLNDLFGEAAGIRSDPPIPAIPA